MIMLLVVLLVIIYVVSLPALRLTKRYKTISKWDYIYPYTGILLWFALVMLNIGKTASLSNFVIENFWITVVSISTPWIIFILQKIKNRSFNLVVKILTILPITFTILLRLLIDTIPE